MLMMLMLMMMMMTMTLMMIVIVVIVLFPNCYSCSIITEIIIMYHEGMIASITGVEFNCTAATQGGYHVTRLI